MEIGIPLLLVVGGLLSVQAAANVQLGRALRSPSGAAALQLAIATVVLLAAAALSETTGQLGRLPDVPGWHLLGGLGSAVYITAGILLLPRLGAVVTVGLFITGQMLVSVLIDVFGWLGVPAVPPDGAVAVGVIAVLSGAAVIVRAQRAVPVGAATGAGGLASGGLRGTGGERVRGGWRGVAAAGRGRWGWPLVAVLAGGALPVQGAINAQLRADLGAPLPVAALSFLLATAVMAVPLAVAVRLRWVERPRWAGLAGVPWWGWLGGLVGAGYVTSVFLLIPEIGAAATIALTVAGQQLIGLAIDHFGLLWLPRRPVRPLRLAGVAVLLAGVVLLQL